jgi:hypothetical protein
MSHSKPCRIPLGVSLDLQQHFQVKKLFRNEDAVRWKQYSNYRAQVGESCKRRQARRLEAPPQEDHTGCCLPEFERDSVRSHAGLVDFACEMGCDQASNEFFLIHGTKNGLVDVILGHVLDPSYASKHSLYGRGVYFSSQTCKCCQYTSDPKKGTLLLCRVPLGDICYVDGPRSYESKVPCIHQCPDRCPHERHHSLVANPGIKNGIGLQVHREFILPQGGAEVITSYVEFVVEFEVATTASLQ